MKRAPHVLDPYVLDTLMADLVGHDHRPSAFLVYLAIVAAAGDGRAALSHAELAERTGLSKRTVQTAVAALLRRSLIERLRRGPTETPHYRPLSPWRRAGEA
jgi:DNA-binding MarR family transcriptional regulator